VEFQIRPRVVTVAPPVFSTLPAANAVVCVTADVVNVDTIGKNNDVNEIWPPYVVPREFTANART
jgi:hypothetical protein